MLEVSSAMSIPRDQALFLAGEGLLKRCSLATIKKASVSSVTVDELARAAESSHQLNNNPTDDAAKKMRNDSPSKSLNAGTNPGTRWLLPSQCTSGV